MLNYLKPLLLLLSVSVALNAQPAHNEQILTSSGGDAVAMDKDWAVVGDVTDNRAHVYKLDYSKMQNDPTNMWVEQQSLIAPNVGKFGSSVAISGENLVIGAPEAGDWKMEVNSVAVDKPQNTPLYFKSVTFSQTFDTVPAVFILTTKDGKQPAALRVRNVSKTGFEVAIREPKNQSNPNHNEMKNVHYLAIEKGSHTLPNGKKIMVGEVSTRHFQEKNNAGSSWGEIRLDGDFTSVPAVLAQVQTNINELNMGSPVAFSDPWLTTAINTVTVDGFDIALETSKTNTAASITQDETIAWLAVEEGTVTINASVSFTAKTDSTVVGWGGGYNSGATCTTVSFPDLGSDAFVVASQNSRNEDDGGWVRGCRAPSSNDVGLAIDENVDPNVSGDNRDHVAEKVGLIAFSSSFTATLSPGSGEAYLYHYDGTGWSLSETIKPDVKGEIGFGSAVGIATDATNAQIIVGAPDSLDSSTPRGKVFTYSWDGSTITPSTTLSGNSVHSIKFGASLDIKGDYLIVGAPDEETVLQNDFVGAAYTFKYDGSAWINNPSNSHFEIKLYEANKHLGTYVAINKDGNVSMVGEDTAGTDTSRIFTNAGAAWTQSHFESSKKGVDIDDGVYMFSRGDSAYNYFDFHDSPTGNSLFKAHASTNVTNAFRSITLYKDQIIGNRPDSNEALTMDIPCGIKPGYLIKDEWAMVSKPCGHNVHSINDIFDNDLGTFCTTESPTETCDWTMYKNGPGFTGKSSNYTKMNSGEQMTSGIGYWIITNDDKTWQVDASEISNRTIIQTINQGTNGISKDIVYGWIKRQLTNNPDTNTDPYKVMVGNAFPRTIDWHNVRLFLNGCGTGTVNTPQAIDTLDGNGTKIMENVAYLYDRTQTGQPYKALAYTPGFPNQVEPKVGFWVRLNPNTCTTVSIGLPFEK